MQANLTVSAALLGWPLVVICLFSLLTPRRAVLVAFLAAWLFLPIFEFKFEGLPNYGKTTATCAGAFVGIALFDGRRLRSLRFRWFDIPVVAWCLCPIPTSLTNGLGIYDGWTTTLSHVVGWGLPYVIGRMYFSDPQGLRELAAGILIGGLVYVPLCLYEVVMSPQLHSGVYGFHQHSFGQTKRFGGWRPTVFMRHGLAVGMWMTVASLSAIWLWKTGALRRLGRIPMMLLVPPLLATTFLCKSFGALALLVGGAAVLFSTSLMRTGVFVGALILLPPAYVALRATDAWSGQELVEASRRFSEQRAQSVDYRFRAERLLADHALKRPFFGWGGWSRNRPSTFNPSIKDMATDGLWVVVLGKYGLVGLGSVLLLILLPPYLVWKNLPPRSWGEARGAPAAVLSMMLLLFMLDSMLNSFITPIYLLAAGGLLGAATTVGSPATDRSSALRRQAYRNPGALPAEMEPPRP